MKVTALIPDSLIDDVKRLSRGRNITDSLTIALTEWIALQKIKAVSRKVKKSPLKFSPGFTAQGIRALNRKR